MRKVQFTETVLRDANQSLIATRLPYDKFEPILETMDQAGFYSAEVWGGATFDVCLRYLHEDPWERLRKIRAKMPNTKLQMLLRGQNVLGYSHYPDDFVRMFVRKSVENGIDIIRIFDALNDVSNLKVAVEETVKAGAIASGTISYTTIPPFIVTLAGMLTFRGLAWSTLDGKTISPFPMEFTRFFNSYIPASGGATLTVSIIIGAVICAMFVVMQLVTRASKAKKGYQVDAVP